MWRWSKLVSSHSKISTEIQHLLATSHYVKNCLVHLMVLAPRQQTFYLFGHKKSPPFSPAVIKYVLKLHCKIFRKIHCSHHSPRMFFESREWWMLPREMVSNLVLREKGLQLCSLPLKIPACTYMDIGNSHIGWMYRKYHNYHSGSQQSNPCLF